MTAMDNVIILRAEPLNISTDIPCCRDNDSEINKVDHSKHVFILDSSNEIIHQKKGAWTEEWNYKTQSC